MVVRRAGGPGEIVEQFGELIEQTLPPEMPFLLVLDTFEEVQYRSRTFVNALWDFLELLQERVHRLRVVIAGRAPVSDRDTKHLELKTLDDEAAAGFLRVRGIDDPDTARFIVKRFGGSPLTLRLAADIVAQDEGGVESLRRVRGRHKLLRTLSAGQETIQRALYGRILSHIHDKRVRALAHPGLALRRITADLIEQVLAQPCRIEVHGHDDATELLDELRNEISLVRPAPEGGVEHRSDLRRLMLPMLVDDLPDKVREIHEGAVDYYAARDAAVDRAEEIYHRLARGDDPGDVEKRWMPELEDYLRDAVPELPVRAQAFLAPLVGVELDDEQFARASRRDRERALELQATDLLRVGNLEEALALLRRASSWSDPGGPLDLLLATALYRVKRYADALATIDRALERRPDDAEARRVLELQELAARIEQEQGDPAAAAARLREAFRLASWLGDVKPALSLGVRRVALQRELKSDNVARVAAEVHDVLATESSDDALKAEPELAWKVAGQLGDTYPDVITRVGRAVAFPSDLAEDGIATVLDAWLKADPAAAGFAEGDAGRNLATLYVLTSEFEVPPGAAACLARLLRERRGS